MHFKISQGKNNFEIYIIHSIKFYFPPLIIFSKQLSQKWQKNRNRFNKIKGTDITSPLAKSCLGYRPKRMSWNFERTGKCILNSLDIYLPIKNQIKWYLKVTLRSNILCLHLNSPKLWNFWDSNQKWKS